MQQTLAGRLTDTFRSMAFWTIVISIVLAIVAWIDRGPYIIVNTFITGGMLALVSMGLALVFGVMNIPMFAHGEYFMIGSLVAYYVFTPISAAMNKTPNAFMAVVGPLIAIGCATVVGFIVGVLSEKLVFYELRKRSRENWVMNSFLLTVGVSVVLINLHQLIFGPDFKGIVRYWSGSPFKIMGAFLPPDRVYAMVISFVVIFSFWLFMRFTRPGRAIRAVSQDETGALIVGINLNFIQMLTMGLSTALAAVAGASLLFMYPSYPTVGMEPLYMAWFVVILVGLGNTLTAVVGAFLVALLKVLTMEYVGTGWEYVVPSAIIIVVLIFKPSGLFSSGVRGVLDK